MKMTFVALFCITLCAGAGATSLHNSLQVQLGAEAEAREQSLVAAWSQELDEQPAAPKKAYKSPIQRVVSLLTQMKAQLETEAKDEAAMYDKMVCWCETNAKEKTKAVADAEALDKELSSDIEAQAAKFGELSTEIARLKEQIATDTAALKTATAIREKEAAAFSDEEKELMQNVVNVKNAVEVLSKHHSGASFAQLDDALLSSMRAVLRDLAFKHEVMMVARSEHAQLSLLAVAASHSQTDTSTALDNSLLSALDVHGTPAAASLPLDIAQKLLARSVQGSGKGGGFLQGALAPTAGSYSPQSGQIFGILKQLKEDFESNLSEAQKAEMKAAADFKGMAAAKSAQIEAAKEKLDEFEGQLADTQKSLSDDKEELALTREQRSKDVEFLQNLKVTCMDLDRQWEERSKTRAAETTAVSEAISILTADDNMDLLRQTVAFLQVGSVSDAEEGSEARARRARTVDWLRKAAQEPNFNMDDLLEAWDGHRSGVHRAVGAIGGPRAELATLAVSASLDSFTKLKETMDKMMADLKKEQEEEVKFKAHCESEFDTTEKETYAKTETKEDLEATIEKLQKLMATVDDEIAAAKANIAETEVAIKKASQVRESENADYQTTVADQRATQEILTKALDKLNSFYKKALLIQAKQEPPVKFNAYKKNADASPVIGMIEQIINDSKALEAEAVAGETNAQASYEKFVKDSNAVISSLTEEISLKTKAAATAKVDLEQAKSDLGSTEGELESLALYEHDLHSECDFVLKNFNIRQKARLDEIEAIQQAKAFLDGMQ